MHRPSDHGPDQVPLESNDPFLDHLKALCHGEQSKNQSIESLVAAAERVGFLETNQDAKPFEALPIDASADRYTATDLNVLKEVGEYQLGKRIGKGGSSQVFEALRKDSKRRFAVKVYTLVGIDSVDRLDVEREALIRLKHPNVVELSDFGKTEDGIYYLVMPLIEGVWIDQFVRKNTIDTRGVAKLFADVADGLQHIHDRGILHRDLKPSNILVTPEGIPVITDFGLAKRIRSSSDDSSTLASITATGTILGTLGYIAPEQIDSDDDNTDQTIDIYGIGATLFSVLTGEKPTEDKNLLKAIRESKTRSTVFPPELKDKIPRDLRSICLKCLEVSSSDRYQSMVSLKKDLLAFSIGSPVSFSKPSLLNRGIRWIQEYPLTLGLASVLVLALVMLLGSFLFF
jgi:eukaryotic-like serine/threonine-protein kinase